MDVSDILDLARDQAHTNNTDFDNDRLLPYLNIVKNNYWSYLVSAVNEDFDWDIFTTDTVVNQDEYVLPAIASDTAGAKKIREVSINYDGETYDDGTLKYLRAREVKENDLLRHWNYYKNNQDVNFPIYYIADDSIFVAPIPSSVVTAGIQVKGIKKIPDYDATTVEADMVIPIDHHDILVQGMLPYILKAQGKSADAQAEKAEYIRQRDQSVKELADRNLTPILMQYPTETEIQNDTFSLTYPYNW